MVSVPAMGVILKVVRVNASDDEYVFQSLQWGKNSKGDEARY